MKETKLVAKYEERDGKRYLIGYEPQEVEVKPFWSGALRADHPEYNKPTEKAPSFKSKW